MLEIDAITEAGRMARKYEITTSVTHGGVGPDDYNINFMSTKSDLGIVVAAFDSKGRPVQFWGLCEFPPNAPLH